MTRTTVFISYSRGDKKWLDKLRVHLKFLEKEHQFLIWDDTKITAGADWKAEIAAAIASARVAVLLVSAHYISSDFIHEKELPPLLAAAKSEGALIFPLIVSHCMFSHIEPLSRFQSFNPPDNPLTKMSKGERDDLFVKVTMEIKAAMLGHQPANPSPKPVPGDAVPVGAALMKLSIARVCVLKVLSEDTAGVLGLSISQIMELSKLKSRKNVVRSIQEMEEAEIIVRNQVGRNVYWKLSKAGEKLSEVLGESILGR